MQEGPLLAVPGREPVRPGPLHLAPSAEHEAVLPVPRGAIAILNHDTDRMRDSRSICSAGGGVLGSGMWKSYFHSHLQTSQNVAFEPINLSWEIQVWQQL